jgi:hypothetical protein
MADSGANVCITPDLSILVDIEDITPIPLGVALHMSDALPPQSSLCTKQGYLPIPLVDGSVHYQPFLINENATDTIISPEHVMQSSTHIATWRQTRSKLSSASNCLTFLDYDSRPVLILPLHTTNGLQYCSNESFRHAARLSLPIVHTVRLASTTSEPSPSTSTPGPRRIFDAELWAARLGFCSKWQLSTIPLHSTGTPHKFYPHPLRFIDHKEQARIRKQPAGSNPEQATLPGQRFFLDFGFMRASASDYTKPNLTTDRVVTSFDSFVTYLLIVDEASRHIWVFLRKSKKAPVDLVSHFLQMYGRHSGGVLQCDQGGELARSSSSITTMLEKHLYTVEPTG